MEKTERFTVSDEFMEKYFGRRIEVLLKDKRVVRGRVGWYGEGEDELELELDLNDIEIDGKKRKQGMLIPESHVVSFTPLEGENTESIFKDV